GLAHRLARLGIAERVVGCALGEPEPLGSDRRPGAVEDPHGDPEALALLTEQVLGRDAHVVEEQLAGRRPLDPHLRLDPADLEAALIGLDDAGRAPGIAGPGRRLARADERPSPA